MPVKPSENIVKAICKDKWDGERVSPSLFTGSRTSVSRLAITHLEDHWDIFTRFVQKPPLRLLERIGEINVGKLQELGRNHHVPAHLTVEPDPLDGWPAHAEVPQNISRGLANKILVALIHHEPPTSKS
jgi:hypothetical protein